MTVDPAHAFPLLLTRFIESVETAAAYRHQLVIDPPPGGDPRTGRLVHALLLHTERHLVTAIHEHLARHADTPARYPVEVTSTDPAALPGQIDPGTAYVHSVTSTVTVTDDLVGDGEYTAISPQVLVWANDHSQDGTPPAGSLLTPEARSRIVHDLTRLARVTRNGPVVLTTT